MQTATQLLVRLDGKEQWIPRNSPRLSNVPSFTAVVAAADGAREEDDHEDDECFVCGNGGKLTCCDVCPRVYHLRCLPAADSAQLRRPSAADEDWWCPRCRRLSRLAFCMTRELGHPAVGAPESSAAELAKRLFAFMSDPQHEQHWDSLREAGQALTSSMPYTLPWMLGDDAMVAATVDAAREEAIAAQETVLPAPPRVAPEWYAGNAADGRGGLTYEVGEERGAVAGDDAAEAAGLLGQETNGPSAPRRCGAAPCATGTGSAGAPMSAAMSSAMSGAGGPFGSPTSPKLPSGFAFKATSPGAVAPPPAAAAAADAAAAAVRDAEDGAGGPIRTSRYRGVSRRYGKWKARIKQNGHDLVIGDFDDELEAALAYDAKARQLHGEKAMINFPPRSAS